MLISSMVRRSVQKVMMAGASLAAVAAGFGAWLLTSGSAAAASGGVSDATLIIAIFLPLFFGGALQTRIERFPPDDARLFGRTARPRTAPALSQSCAAPAEQHNGAEYE